MTENFLNNAIEKCFNYYFSDKNSPEKVDSLAHIIKKYKEKDSFFLFPYNVFFKITSQCNLRCKHCFYYSSQENFSKVKDMTNSDIMNLLKYLIEEKNVIYFTITGGEPFLNKNILEILEYIKSQNVYVQIKTNGTLITQKHADKLSEIFNKNIDTVSISLDGPNAKINDSIRGEGNFKKTICAAKMLTEKGIKVNINYTLTSANIKNLTELYDLCSDLNVNSCSIGQFIAFSDEQKYLEPSDEDAFIAVAELINLFNRNKNGLKLISIPFMPFCFLKYKKGRELMDKYLLTHDLSKKCDYSCSRHEKLTICADGKISLCPQTEDDGLNLGNIQETSLEELWQNRFDNVFFQKRDLKNSVCFDCKYLSICGAGCPAEAYKKFGTVNAPDSRCIYSK